ncbi:MAG: hypothetical protein ACRCZB_05140 [Bacteroidales bacterium]
MKYFQENELGNTATPAGYGKPNFGVGNPVEPGINPDQSLNNGSEPNEKNPGFSMGDTYIESEDYNSVEETELLLGTDPEFTEENNEFEPVYEENPEIEENEDTLMFDSIDEIPDFEEYDELDTADADIDANGVIDPERVTDVEVDVELGEIPDTSIPMTEPIVTIDSDEPDVYATQEEIDGVDPEPIVVNESFRLPENKNIVVSKGDQIFIVGKASNEKTPKFSESVFKRAFRSLVESKNASGVFKFKKNESLKKCALVGRSLLLEVAHDWRLPETNIIFESHDILQIVSMKPVTGSPLSEGGGLDNFGNKKAPPFKKESDDCDKNDGDDDDEKMEEKLRLEAILARKRYEEAKAKNCKKETSTSDDKEGENGNADDKDSKKSDDKDDKKEPESKDSKAKKEAFLRANGIYF